jgi:uncharacterized repeat protein (TIGR01451 family)
MPRSRSILLLFAAAFFAVSASAQTADLLIAKSGDESVTAGETIAYSLFVFNSGPSDAVNVTVSDPLPSGTTFVSLVSSTTIFNCNTPPVGSGGTVTCTAPSFQNQAETSFTLSVKTSPSAPSGSINNTATITSATPDPNTSDNSSSASTGIVAGSSTSADLAIESMFGPSSVSAGATMTFQVSIANRGPSTAHNVQLVDAVPANATFVSATVFDPLAVFTCTTPGVGATGNITCNASTLDPRSSSDQPVFLFTFRVNNGVAAGTVLSNTATLSATDADPIPGNNTASGTSSVTSQSPTADVAVSTTGGGSTFSVTVSNIGPNDAANVTLTDAVPSGSTFANWTQTSGPHFNCSTPAAGGSGTITCNIAILPGIDGKTISATFDLVLDTTAQVVNSVTVSSSTSDPRSDNNSASFPVAAKLTVADVTVLEGNSGTTPAVFTIKLQPPNATLTATVDYLVRGLSATASVDFIGSQGTLIFPPGTTQKTVTVQVIGDTLNEGDELFSFELSNPVNAVMERGTALGRIADDDQVSAPLPTASIDSILAAEGNSGTSNATFTARLSFAAASIVRLRWQTQDGTAVAGSDYITANGEVTFQPGELAKTFTVVIIGDKVVEPDEFFAVAITGVDNALTGQAATCLILNDDSAAPPPPVVPPRHRAVRH